MSTMPEISGFSRLADARKAALDGQFEAAAELASAILERLPNCLVALRILAWAQLELGDDSALETFEQCAEADPEDALAHVGQAIWYQQHADTDSATGEWVRAWELDPQNQSIRRGLVRLTGELPESTFADAISLLRDQRDEVALDALKRVRTERKEAAVEMALLSAMWHTGREREALDLATSVLMRHPRNVKAALFVASLEDRAGRTLRSRESIARAEQADPGLMLYADVVRQVGLQPALDLQRGLAGARTR